MMKTLLSICFVVLLGFTALGQSTVTGKVTDSEDGTPLPGVTILEKGTSNGAITDVDGNYSITLTKDNAVLVMQYVGFATAEYNVGNQSVINAALEPDIMQLGEIVVTAFGIERQADQVGYATAKVQPDEFAEAKQISVMQSLAGRVAGVNITAPPTGPAGSTNIVIRGIQDLSGDNRPLIIIDGVIVSNNVFDPASRWGGRDTGDGLTSLNPDDIASIDILKGASAATLYGTAAQGGAIIVTTKQGVARKGIGVEVNSNYVFEDVAVFPDFQDQYGQGTQGVAPTTAAEATTFNSWGERLEGQDVINFDGVSRPYVALDRKDNLKKFYETGSTFTNTVALSGGNETANARFSISNLDHSGIVPNTEYERFSLNLITRAKLGEKITTEMKANYVKEEALNRPNLSDNPSNPGKSLGLIPANVDIDLYRDNIRDEFGNAIQVFNTPFTLNPFWGPFENINSDSRNRFLGFFKMGYKITDWLSIQGRVSLDYYTQRLNSLEELGTAHNVNGAVENDTRTSNTQSHDLLLLGSTDFAEDFSVDYTLGITRFSQEVEFFRGRGTQLLLRDVPNINNAQNRDPATYTFTEVQQNAIFANANIGYKKYLYLDLAVRQEWLSTLTDVTDLDGSDNTLTFGSVSGSFIFSEAMDLPDVISYGKLRASYGTAGGGTLPYRTSLTYSLEGTSFNGASNGRISNDIFPNPNIKPNLTTSREIGLNMSFFNERISLDATIYQTNTDNQILSTSVSAASGYE